MADPLRVFAIWRPSYGRSIVGCFIYLFGVILVASAFVTYFGGFFGAVGIVFVAIGSRLSRCRWYYVGAGIGSVTTSGLLLEEHSVLSRDLISRAWLLPISDNGVERESMVVVECRGCSRSVILKGTREHAERLIDDLHSTGMRTAVPISRRWAAFLPPFPIVLLLACLPAILLSTPTNPWPVLLPLFTIGIRLWLWRERFEVLLEDQIVRIGTRTMLPLAAVEAVETAEAHARILVKGGLRFRVWTRGWSGRPCLPPEARPSAQAVAIRSLIERTQSQQRSRVPKKGGQAHSCPN